VTQMVTQPQLDLADANARLQEATAEEIIRWAVETFGDRLVMSSSFGVQSAVMLHLVTRIVPDVPVILIDTGYLFPETYMFAEQLRERLDLNLKIYTPRLTAAMQEALYGKLWEQGEEGLTRYHQINKIEPMQRALEDLGAKAWLAGLRADQTEYRKGLETVTRQSEVYKVHPILRWTARDVHAYMTEHDLPYHPLLEEGYVSVGDVHSTRKVDEDEHERAGRFGGLKQECGLHLPMSEEESQSRDASGL